MWLLAGLGNPGNQYALTRHNIGFVCLDFLFQALQGHNWQSEHKSLVAKLKWEFPRSTEQVLLVKPQTFMNLSGEAVLSLMHFYKIPPEKLLVIHDDIDQAFGAMKFQKSRGHGGHNGVRSITGLLGHSDYLRLKLGVGRPPHPKMEVADYVLQKFSEMEQAELSDFLNRAGDGIELLLSEGLSAAATKYNGTN